MRSFAFMTPEYEDYLAGTKGILDDSRNEKQKYEVMVLGKKFIVFPNVFSPKYFHDTAFFAENVPVKLGDEFLEIGPGTGVISVFAALKGASRIVAVDINPDAVENTRANARLHNLDDRITVYQGDVYEPLPTDERFDTIFWNTPFGYVEHDVDTLEKAVCDPGYKATKRFVFGAQDRLKPGGKLLIGFSTTLGKFDILEQFLKDAGYKTKLLVRIESVEAHPVTFEIYEATL